MADIKFSFSFIVNGQAEFSWSGKDGLATEEELILDGSAISIGDIVDTVSREERLLLALHPEAQLSDSLKPRISDKNVLVLHMNSGSTEKLERHIDRRSSAFLAEKHKEELDVAGKGSEFRAMICPSCQATIDLTAQNPTPFTYCRFCESVVKESGELATNGHDYRICEECNYFGRVQNYTVFYFYFLLVIYGWRMNRRYLCDSCVRPIMIKALFINLIFILGVPFALWGLFKSYLGGDPLLANLATANKLAQQGKYQEADIIFQQHMNTGTIHPGLAMNKGLGHLRGKDGNGAVECFGESLKACSNYSPVLRLLQRLGS